MGVRTRCVQRPLVINSLWQYVLHFTGQYINARIPSGNVRGFFGTELSLNGVGNSSSILMGDPSMCSLVSRQHLREQI